MGYTLRLKAAARGFSYKEGGADETGIEIEQETEVEWSWMISFAGVTPQIQMQKVSNKGDASGDNMWSEPIIGNEGKFTKQFKNKGTYHYSTGLMDMATTFASALSMLLTRQLVFLSTSMVLKLNILAAQIMLNQLLPIVLSWLLPQLLLTQKLVTTSTTVGHLHQIWLVTRCWDLLQLVTKVIDSLHSPLSEFG